MKLGQNGIGLIQVMIAVAGVSGISYTIMNQAEMDRKIKVKANFDQQYEAHAQLIRSELSDVFNCTASFAGKPVGNEATPTVIPATEGIDKGHFNQLTNLITPVSMLLGIRSPGSSGLYIDQMQLLSRPPVYFDHATGGYETGDPQDVLRVSFIAGSIDSNGGIRPSASGLGPGERSLDIPLITKKDGLVIETCYFDAMNSVREACENIPNAVWDDLTKKCELPLAVLTDDLMPLWTNAGGALVSVRPPDVPNGEVTCQKNHKQCGRTEMDCNLPACPANHYIGGAWEWDRCQQDTWVGCVDWACMKSAKCMYIAQPAGYMVKP